MSSHRCAAFKSMSGFVPGQHLSTDYALVGARAGRAAIPRALLGQGVVGAVPTLTLTLTLT